jgi:Ca-activated chloride channel family protein
MKANHAFAALIVLGTFWGNDSFASSMEILAELGQPVMQAGAKQTTYLKVKLIGQTIENSGVRLPVNVAIVLDRSGSMRGAKLQRAKEAAIAAIARLDAKDIISVVAYDDAIQVLVPATRVSDKARIYAAIHALSPGNTTALFAGVSRGAKEVRKFLSDQQVNRVILLSDGLANVGPSSPQALGALGASLIKEGISVTTIGLGLDYNEDLMVALASRSDGNHTFVENAADLARIFNYEFGDILSVVARDVEITITCPVGVRPVRVLGRDANVIGQAVRTHLNQVYGRQEKFVLVEVEVPANSASIDLPVANVGVDYRDAFSQTQVHRAIPVTAKFSFSDAEVTNSTNHEVMVSATQLIANERTKKAVALRDQGRLDDARQLLEENYIYLNENASRYRSEDLKKQGYKNKEDSTNLDGVKWNRQRKSMRRYEHMYDNQQGW